MGKSALFHGEFLKVCPVSCIIHGKGLSQPYLTQLDVRFSTHPENLASAVPKIFLWDFEETVSYRKK